MLRQLFVFLFLAFSLVEFSHSDSRSIIRSILSRKRRQEDASDEPQGSPNQEHFSQQNPFAYAQSGHSVGGGSSGSSSGRQTSSESSTSGASSASSSSALGSFPSRLRYSQLADPGSSRRQSSSSTSSSSSSSTSRGSSGSSGSTGSSSRGSSSRPYSGSSSRQQTSSGGYSSSGTYGVPNTGGGYQSSSGYPQQGYQGYGGLSYSSQGYGAAGGGQYGYQSMGSPYGYPQSQQQYYGGGQYGVGQSNPQPGGAYYGSNYGSSGGYYGSQYPSMYQSHGSYGAYYGMQGQQQQPQPQPQPQPQTQTQYSSNQYAFSLQPSSSGGSYSSGGRGSSGSSYPSGGRGSSASSYPSAGRGASEGTDIRIGSTSTRYYPGQAQDSSYTLGSIQTDRIYRGHLANQGQNPYGSSTGYGTGSRTGSQYGRYQQSQYGRYGSNQQAYYGSSNTGRSRDEGTFKIPLSYNQEGTSVSSKYGLTNTGVGTAEQPGQPRHRHDGTYSSITSGTRTSSSNGYGSNSRGSSGSYNPYSASRDGGSSSYPYGGSSSSGRGGSSSYPYGSSSSSGSTGRGSASSYPYGGSSSSGSTGRGGSSSYPYGSSSGSSGRGSSSLYPYGGSSSSGSTGRGSSSSYPNRGSSSSSSTGRGSSSSYPYGGRSSSGSTERGGSSSYPYGSSSGRGGSSSYPYGSSSSSSSGRSGSSSYPYGGSSSSSAGSSTYPHGSGSSRRIGTGSSGSSGGYNQYSSSTVSRGGSPSRGFGSSSSGGYGSSSSGQNQYPSTGTGQSSSGATSQNAGYPYKSQEAGEDEDSAHMTQEEIEQIAAGFAGATGISDRGSPYDSLSSRIYYGGGSSSSLGSAQGSQYGTGVVGGRYSGGSVPQMGSSSGGTGYGNSHATVNRGRVQGGESSVASSSGYPYPALPSPRPSQSYPAGGNYPSYGSNSQGSSTSSQSNQYGGYGQSVYSGGVGGGYDQSVVGADQSIGVNFPVPAGNTTNSTQGEAQQQYPYAGGEYPQGGYSDYPSGESTPLSNSQDQLLQSGFLNNFGGVYEQNVGSDRYGGYDSSSQGQPSRGGISGGLSNAGGGGGRLGTSGGSRQNTVTGSPIGSPYPQGARILPSRSRGRQSSSSQEIASSSPPTGGNAATAESGTNQISDYYNSGPSSYSEDPYDDPYDGNYDAGDSIPVVPDNSMAATSNPHTRQQLGDASVRPYPVLPSVESTPDVIPEGPAVERFPVFSNLGGGFQIVQRINETQPLPTPQQPHTVQTPAQQGLLPDLQLDKRMLLTHFFLDRKTVRQLQCAKEEKCLAELGVHYIGLDTQRRLLRFETTVRNVGKAPFLPQLRPEDWYWHECHNHSHSMKVFSHYDLYNQTGAKVAQGHKASFCLEDSKCGGGARKVYNCDRGIQGISPGCQDTYKASIDCQWIDITTVPLGQYVFRVAINPNKLVPESSFKNNAIECKVAIRAFTADIWGCIYKRI